MLFRVLAENEDERHQVYLCAFNYALGVRRVLKGDATGFLLSLTASMLQNEASQSNVARNLELLSSYITELAKDNLPYKPLSEPSVADELIKILGDGVLKSMYNEHVDLEVFYSVCELLTSFVRADVSTNYQRLYAGLL